MRAYFSEGQPLPSVTTILDQTMPPEQRARIDRFFMRTGALKENVEAIRRGETVDAWAKAFLMRSRIPPVDFQFNGFIRQLQPYLERWRDEAEEIQVNVQLIGSLYGGTADLLLKLGDGWTVVDIKTKRFILLDAVLEAKLQCLGYAEILTEQGTSIEAIAPLVVTRNESKLFHVSDPGEMKNLRQLWDIRVSQFYRKVYETEETPA
jgi:hypothetical protein